MDRIWNMYDKLTVLRNLILAPITEELVFRSIIVCSVYLSHLNQINLHSVHNQFVILMKSNAKQVIELLPGKPILGNAIAMQTAFLSPVWFGVAHLHHLLDKVRNGENFKHAILSSVIQFTYTSIFGFVAALLFMRTGSIYSAITSHMICNFIGLPDIGFMYDPKNAMNTRDCSSYSCLYPLRYFLLVIHVIGLLLFATLLFPLTQSFVSQSLYFED